MLYRDESKCPEGHILSLMGMANPTAIMKPMQPGQYPERQFLGETENLFPQLPTFRIPTLLRSASLPLYTALKRRREGRPAIVDLSWIHSPPATSCATDQALCEGMPDIRVVFVFIDVMDTDMSGYSLVVIMR